MKTYNLFVLFFTLTVINSKAQNLGNEWINTAQSYYKIKITQQGIYRISYNTLQNNGIPVNTIKPQDFQIFAHGKEQFLYIHGASDNSFDHGDYIEFFADKNDGKLDSLLYMEPKQQAHTKYSLYTDTNIYFLTWNNAANHKRYKLKFENNYSDYTAEDYYIKEAFKYFTDNYYDGTSPFSELKISYYNDCEGWGGKTFKQNKNVTYTINTPNYNNATSVKPKLKLIVRGLSDAKINSGYTNHNLYAKIASNSSSYTTIIDTNYKGYSNIKAQYYLNNLDIAGTTKVRIGSKNPTPRSAYWTDRQAVFFLQIEYPAYFSLNNDTTQYFRLIGYKGSKSYIKFLDYNKQYSKPIIFDLTNGNKIYATLQSDTLNAIIPNGGTKKDIFIVDSVSAIKINKLEFIKFNNLLSSIPANFDYLIVTHPKLWQGATGYANFRNNSGYHTHIANIEQIYSQFSYGIHHPIALRRYISFLEKNNILPEYLFLIGKGFQNQYVRQLSFVNNDLIPAFGTPPSDLLYSAKSIKKNSVNLEPKLAIGRLAARNNAEVKDYIDKVKKYEKIDTQMWRKNIMHLSGGKDFKENQVFEKYLNHQKAIAEREYFGGKVTTFSKTSSIVIDDTWKKKIIDHINNGITLVNYFGHGASDVLELDIGEPSEYNNQDKLLMFYFTGCIIGNCFTNTFSMGERFLHTPKVGAIIWMAGTSTGYASEYQHYSLNFYQNMFHDNYGEPIGKIITHTIKDYQTIGNIINEMQCLQTFLQGDPAIKLFSPDKPDYKVSKSKIFISPENVNTEADSFNLGIIIDNLGKAINDTFDLFVEHQFGKSRKIAYPKIAIKTPFRSDSLLFKIKKDSLNFLGNNKFRIYVDSNTINGQIGEITELRKDNNETNFEYFFQNNGVTALLPQEYSIVPDSVVNLVAQSSKFLVQNEEYMFELDTLPYFNSPFLKKSGIIQDNHLVEWKVSLLKKDTTVYYWRVKLKNDTIWQPKKSFTYIDKSPAGWSQCHFPQFYESVNTKKIGLDSTKRKMYYGRLTSDNYNIFNYGGDVYNAKRKVKYNYKTNWCWDLARKSYQGMILSVINPDFNTKYQINVPYEKTHDCTGGGVYVYDWVTDSNTVDTNILNDFFSFIDSIPDKYHVLAFTGVHLIPDMDSNFFRAMQKIGAGQKLKQLNYKEPYTLIGIKNGKGIEQVADSLNPLPTTKQTLLSSFVTYPLASQGTVYSEIIGPATNWKDFFIEYSPIKDTLNKLQDSLAIVIYGIKNDGTKVELIHEFNSKHKDLRDSIDAKVYPYIQIETRLNDTKFRTPPQIKKWIVLYDYAPEGTLITDNYMFYADTLQQGDNMNIKIAFKNISRFPMDSVYMEYWIKNQERKYVLSPKSKMFRPLYSQDTIMFEKSFNVSEFKEGKHQISIFFNKDYEQEEQFLFNNYYQKDFFIKIDKTNPLLDVTFDGYHIKNKDTVSPNPNILIIATDENKFLFLDSSKYFKVKIKYPDSDTLIEANINDLTFYSGTKRNNNKAKMYFRPKKLKDGMHQLRVNVMDKSGNWSGDLSYTVDFFVVNQEAISKVEVFPNPANKKINFLFKFVGQEMPEKIVVNIINSLGQRLKSIEIKDIKQYQIGLNTYLYSHNLEGADKLPTAIYIYDIKTFTKNNEKINIFLKDKQGVFTRRDIGKMVIVND